MMKLLPQNMTFFDLLEASSRRVLDSARLLDRLVRGDREAWERCQALRAQGHTDEGVTHQLIDKLNRTFVTPLDREDIHDLAFKLDAITGAILNAAARVSAYRFKDEPTQVLTLMKILLAACEDVVSAVSKLRKPKDLKEALTVCRSIHRLGNDADVALHAALDALFSSPVEAPADVLAAMLAKDVYEVLKKAIDRCEDVADLVHGVAVKNA